MSALPVLAFVLFVAGVIALGIHSAAQERKRRQAIALEARRLGLSFSEKDNRGVADLFSFIPEMNTGDNRYAFNVAQGIYRQQEVGFFDYHYETESTDGKGNKTTHHHYHHFFLLHTPLHFPELRIAPENILDRIGQALGFEDIDFESDEFSRAFCVKSKDKKFAYDVCHARFMEFILQHIDLTLNYENGYIALCFSGAINPQEIEARFRLLLEIEGLLPGYLRNPASEDTS